HRRARSRSAPRQRPAAHHGPAHICTATSSGPPAATTPPASTPPRCPAHPPAPARPRRSDPATQHARGGNDVLPCPLHVSPQPHLKKRTAAMVAVRNLPRPPMERLAVIILEVR